MQSAPVTRSIAGGGVVAWARRARIRHWLHFLALPAASWSMAPARWEMGLSVARGVATAFCVLSFGYLVNAFADRHMDDPAKRVAHDADDPRPVLTLLAIAALGLSSMGPPAALCATAICLLSGWVYSVGPRLKAYPVVGTLLNATNFAPLLLVGLSRADFPRHLTPLTISFVALLLQNQLLHEAADAAEDARGEVVTTARAVGPRATALFAAAVGAALPATIANGGHLIAAVVAAIAFVGVFPVVLARSGHDLAAMRRARQAHRVASMVAGALVFLAFVTP